MSELSSPYILLDDCLGEPDSAQSLLFDNAEQIIIARTVDEVSPALDRIDALIQEGFYVAGFIAYEVAAAFEGRLKSILEPGPDQPLIWMIATREVRRMKPQDVEDFLQNESDTPATIIPGDQIPSRDNYCDKISQIHDYIKAGDVYQINYTFNQPFTVGGSVASLYTALRKNQPVHYGALIKTGRIDILSLSPELFLSCKNGRLTARPMKGTAPRGKDAASDSAIAASMQKDEKSRAENLMIVDLLRNDLSRIAEPGSVKVPALFEVEKYQTLLQMTSTVEATLSDNNKPSDILAALFPCGSVTGAPKIRAMEIINQLEQRPRGIYCGTIGFFAPDGDFTLSVPIRTATIDNNGQGAMGIGSGIVADSIAEDEYDECLLKARFLTDLNPPYDLIETLKWTPQEGFIRLDLHLQRMTKSAVSFHRPMDIEHIKNTLIQAVEAAHCPQRVRISLARDGKINVTCHDIPESSGQILEHICLAAEPVNSHDLMLYHKTSKRDLFDFTRKKAMELHGVLDVIFTNEKGEITQGAISNIFAEIDGILVTPPVASGLLPGIMRQTLLEGPQPTKEITLTVNDLKKSKKLFICNSLRGLIPVELLTIDPVIM